VPVRSRLALLTVMSAGLMAAACGGPAAPAPAATAATPAAARSRVALAIPPGEGGGAFAIPRTLIVPPGWAARVWARVPDARMEAWTPEGDLLVSQPNLGSIVELKPGAHGTAAPHVLLSGLTLPQGMAFARVAGHWVLYVGESDQIDRYPWDAAGDRWGRPVDAVAGPDGALYVSDDTAGAVYHLAPPG
jgi:glucose/arabinose dehydrogenase